ncbi:hypothetical protein [Halofilum ochraceum]|uniref:hypothetical protein n=1 Tax=Halofilum ochraceum TaxID=1611323 RepID=UPI0008D8DC2C|nr:hypothetical protein [Halofilum ochraceum]
MGNSLRWFRMYAEAIDDEKLRLLAFEDRWHFVALMCCKAQGLFDTDDDPDMVHRKLAVKLGVQARELDEIHRRLQAVGLVNIHLEPVNWDKRQFRHDNSADRTRRYRERLRGEGQGENEVNDCDGHSDAPSRARATETESDTETETSPGERRSPSRSPRRSYPQWFEDLWAKVPKRAGSQDKKAAFEQCNGRLAEGFTVEQIGDGLDRYRTYLHATGRIGTDKVLMGKTFMGPADPPHFLNDWTPPAAIGGGSSHADVTAEIERDAPEEAIDGEYARTG